MTDKQAWIDSRLAEAVTPASEPKGSAVVDLLSTSLQKRESQLDEAIKQRDDLRSDLALALRERDEWRSLYLGEVEQGRALARMLGSVVSATVLSPETPPETKP